MARAEPIETAQLSIAGYFATIFRQLNIDDD